jgi:hypothetical protein
MQLLYAGARWYDPKVGRFLSPDAVRFHFGGDAYFNRYAYANNNPLVLVDSDGNAAALRAPYMAGNFVGRVAVAPLINYTISTLVMGGAVADYTLGSYIYDVVHNESAPSEESPKPSVDEPHTQLGQKDGRKGRYPQAREFDGEGNPVRDIDFTDHGRGHPNPHQHPYKENPTGGTRSRGGYEPL